MRFYSRRRPSADDLAALRKRGLPWVVAVFVLLVILIASALVYQILQTRQKETHRVSSPVQRKPDIAISSERRLPASTTTPEPTATAGTIRPLIDEFDDNVRVDVVPIISWRTRATDPIITTGAPISVFVSTPTHPLEPTEYVTTTTTTPTPTTTTTTTATTTTATTTTNTVSTTPVHTTTSNTPTTPILYTPTILPSFSTSTEAVTSTTETTIALPLILTTSTTQSTTERPTPATSAATAITKESLVENVTKTASRIPWRRETLSTVEELRRFGATTPHPECSRIATKVLEKKGNAFEAGIAAEFCLAAVHPHDTGPGFGIVATLHNSNEGRTYVVDGRERAPRTALAQTFAASPRLASLGYSSIATPGWVCALWTVYRKFGSGRIHWQDLILPTVELMVQRGITVDDSLGKAIEAKRGQVNLEKSFHQVLNASTRAGAPMLDLQLAELFRKLATSRDASQSFYHGDIAAAIADEMKQRGGLLSRADLAAYECDVTHAVDVDLQRFRLRGPDMPSTFPLMKFFFHQILAKFNSSDELINDADFFQHIIQVASEATEMKNLIGGSHFHVQAQQLSEGWAQGKYQPSKTQQPPSFVPSDGSYVASKVLIIDGDGNALSMTSTNNNEFGSLRRSKALGFVWNNAMDAFDVVCQGESNCISGTKKPAYSAIPSILLNTHNQVILAVAAGGDALMTTAQLALHHAFSRLPIPAALDLPKFFPAASVVDYEPGVPAELLQGLGMKARLRLRPVVQPQQAAFVLHRLTNDTIEAICDFRAPSRCFPMGQ